MSIEFGNKIVDLKYFNFDYININDFKHIFRILSTKFNLTSKDLSYTFDVIIRKAISSNIFKKELEIIKNNKNSKYSNEWIYGYNKSKKLYMLPYLKEIDDTSNHKINYLYIKLKMFIKKFRADKNIKRDILFKPVLFELLNYHSNINVQPIKKVGNTFSYKPPHLMFPGEIELINNFIIREKADGELVKKLPTNIDPPFDMTCDIKAEYIEDLDLYLVFDCDINMSITNKYNYLRNKHYITRNSKLKNVSSMKYLVECIEEERELFNTFIEKDYDTCRWYPKSAWNIITMDQEFINNIYNFINEKSIYNSIILSNDYYENDGFIISPIDETNEIKVKPKSLMTIDLEYDGNNFIDREKNIYNIIIDDNISVKNGIYRCYPIEDNFIAREVRYDKKKPNPYDVVNNIINLSKIEYKIKNQLYYHNVNFKYNKTWQKIVKDNMDNLLNVNNFMYKNQNVLDLGCGKSKVLKLGIEYTDYTGYDYDVYVLLKNMKNMRNISSNNIHFNYINLSEDWNETKDKFYDVKYNKYMNIYAVNSLMHFNTDKFWEQIDRVSQKGTRFLFNILQSNKCKEIYWTSNNSYIKQKLNNIELYFENVHSKPLIEKYITIKDVEKYLKKYNFDIIYKYSSTNDNITDLYDWYVCEKII